MPRIQADIPTDKIADFCRKWRIVELSLFGSVLRDDFSPESDIDVMVEFAPGAGWSLFDILAMQEELQEIFGRQVDIVEKAGLKNPFRRHAILRDREIIHAS